MILFVVFCRKVVDGKVNKYHNFKSSFLFYKHLMIAILYNFLYSCCLLYSYCIILFLYSYCLCNILFYFSVTFLALNNIKKNICYYYYHYFYNNYTFFVINVIKIFRFLFIFRDINF